MLSFLATAELLKKTPRRGWVLRGIDNPETVADHMYQMALICSAYPWGCESERARAIEMAIVHDAPEAIAGDTTPSDGVSREAKHIKESLGLDFLRCLARQGNNTPFADRIKDLWDEYEQGTTTVSKVVHQVDKLEALQQAYFYSSRYPTRDLSDFKGHRASINDDWLAQQADEVLRKWNAHDARAKSNSSIVFVIGGPGVGKGTHCKLSAQDMGFHHISVGELLRKEQGNLQSPFQEFIQNSFRHSVVVPAILTMQLLEKEFHQAQAQGKIGILVDGFPRSMEQLLAFEEYITTNYATIVLDCSDETLRQRLVSRSAHSGREDDNPDTIHRRIHGFRDSQRHIVEELSKQTIHRIDCDGSIADVQTSFRSVLEEILSMGSH